MKPNTPEGKLLAHLHVEEERNLDQLEFKLWSHTLLRPLWLLF